MSSPSLVMTGWRWMSELLLLSSGGVSELSAAERTPGRAATSLRRVDCISSLGMSLSPSRTRRLPVS